MSWDTSIARHSRARAINACNLAMDRQFVSTEVVRRAARADVVTVKFDVRCFCRKPIVGSHAVGGPSGRRRTEPSQPKEARRVLPECVGAGKGKKWVRLCRALPGRGSSLVQGQHGGERCRT